MHSSSSSKGRLPFVHSRQVLHSSSKGRLPAFRRRRRTCLSKSSSKGATCLSKKKKNLPFEIFFERQVPFEGTIFFFERQVAFERQAFRALFFFERQVVFERQVACLCNLPFEEEEEPALRRRRRAPERQVCVYYT